ncbi:hypothetical protein D3C81_1620440 [compost metagenome]
MSSRVLPALSSSSCIVRGTAPKVNWTICAPSMNRSSWLRQLPDASSTGMAVAALRAVRMPPVGTIRLFAPLPSVPRTKGPSASSGAPPAITLAAAASPNSVRTLRSRALMYLE